ncbi:MAG TPA: response regulator [Candidatus Methylomirabilis sp.]
MKKPRILVVDDEWGIRHGLKALLDREGYDAQTAGDAWDAVRWIKRVPFDGVLIDMDLTRDADLGINGLDVIVLLRIHQPDAKAILISASGDSTLTRLALERGAVARLEKPVDLAALRRLLRSLFPSDGPTTPSSPVLCPSG